MTNKQKVIEHYIKHEVVSMFQNFKKIFLEVIHTVCHTKELLVDSKFVTQRD